MPKTDLQYPDDYAPVAERIRLFYERHPQGQILTHLISQRADEITFTACIYREPSDRRPSATGWASERVGDGDVNTVACLENTETSAIGRALANLGFTASRQRPSTEEMMKAARARARGVGTPGSSGDRTAGFLVRQSSGGPLEADPLQRRANQLTETLALLAIAQSYGLRPARAERIRARLMSDTLAPDALRLTSQLLRNWLAKQRRRRSEGDIPDPTSTAACG